MFRVVTRDNEQVEVTSGKHVDAKYSPPLIPLLYSETGIYRGMHVFFFFFLFFGFFLSKTQIVGTHLNLHSWSNVLNV